MDRTGTVGITAWAPCIQPCWRDWVEAGGKICAPLTGSIVLECQRTGRNSLCTDAEFEGVKSEFLRLCEYPVDIQSSTMNPVPKSTGSSTTSATPTATRVASASSRTGSSGLATGAKAGIAVGAVVLLAIAALFFWNRRRSRRAQKLKVLPNHEENYDEEQKAELPGTQGEGGAIIQKSELPGHGSRVKVAELDQQQGGSTTDELKGQRDLKLQNERSVVNELEGRPDSEELDVQSTVNELDGESHAYTQESQPTHTPIEPNIFTSHSSGDSSTLAGSVPVASDLYPSTQSQAQEDQEETDIQFQERRLKERRAMIAEKERLALEKEQIAMEEEALRRRKALQKPS